MKVMDVHDARRRRSVDTFELERAHCTEHTVMFDAPLASDGIPLIGVHAYPECRSFNKRLGLVRELAPEVISDTELPGGVGELGA